MKSKTAQSASDWKGGFLFLGNQLALDFLNTRPLQNGELVELLPDFAALLRWLSAAGVLTARQAAALRRGGKDTQRVPAAFDAALHLREALRKEILTWEAGAPLHTSMIEELNRWTAAHPRRTRLMATRDSLLREPWFPMEEPEDVLGPLADSAAALFADVERERVRMCGQCVLHYYDTSRKGTRRWCSMQLCGNRAKVAAYAARQRDLSP